MGIIQSYHGIKLIKESDASNDCSFQVAKKPLKSHAKGVVAGRQTIRYFVVITSLLLFLSIGILAQDCPSFQEVEIRNTQVDIPDGSVVFRIMGTKQYDKQNFEVRQKQKHVTGQLDFDVDVTVVGDELRISGLKRSNELYLEEYVIFFSDRSCENGRVVEVGTFKIN